MADLVVETPHSFSVRATPINAAAVTPGGATVILVPTPGVPGPPGPAGDGGFTHVQTAPAATWTISNPLGRKPASVTVWIDDEMVHTSIETPDTATVVVSFASPQSGRAEII